MRSEKEDTLFLCSWFPNRRKGLEGNFILKHAICLLPHTNVHVLFAASSNENSSTYEIEKSVVEGVRVTKVYYNKSNFPFFAFLINILRYHLALKKAWNTMDLKPKRVVVNVAFPVGLFAIFLKRKYNYNFGIIEHWSGYLKETNVYNNSSFVLKYLHRRIFDSSSKVLAVSNTLGDSLKKHGLVESYTQVPNFIDKKEFYPREKNDVFHFIHVSTADEEIKNFSKILAVFQELKKTTSNFKLNLIVEADRESVEKKVKDYNLFDIVNLQTNLSSKKVAELLGSSNCLVQFSNVETFSIVLAEAWLSGVPCVYSKCGGLTNIQDKDMGIQVAKRDEKALLVALINMLDGFFAIDEKAIVSKAESMFNSQRIIDEVLALNVEN